MPLTVERCPNCLAPLELGPNGDCRFCAARVSETDDDDEEEDDADAIIRRLDIGEYDATLPQPASAVIVVLRYAAYDARALERAVQPTKTF